MLIADKGLLWQFVVREATVASNRPSQLECLIALTIDIFVNALTGRPPRALVAYDGR